MGGNVFKSVTTTRIRRDQIHSTLDYIADQLEFPGLTLDYLKEAVMGSTGKKETSGDIDIALNSIESTLIGDKEYPVLCIKKLSKRLVEVLPETHRTTKQLPAGQLFTAWPISGVSENGFVQVDFIKGKLGYLLFTHHFDESSRFKGLFRSILMSCLAKYNVDYVRFTPEDVRTHKINLALNLETGLYRSWRMLHRGKFGRVDPDLFETLSPGVPRFERLEEVNSPKSVLELLFDSSVNPEDVDTFEKMACVLRDYKQYDAQVVLERLLVNVVATRTEFDEAEVRSYFSL